MPTLWAHSHYWSNANPSTVVDLPAVGGYPGWQTSVILGSGFGISQVIWEWMADRNARTTTQAKGK
jgi:hypothetical protein